LTLGYGSGGGQWIDRLANPDGTFGLTAFVAK
jgi:hypothetical protein